MLEQGNSMGTIAALHAPLPETHRMESILLVSPPVTIFWVLSFLRPPKGFHAGLKAILDASPETDSANGQSSQRRIPICIIYGNQDPFTRAGSYRALGRKYAQKGLMMTEIDGAGHFHHSEKEGEGVKRAIGEWLDSL